MPPTPPTGTVTFLFTDIEGSTQLWEHQPEAMRAALAQHDALLRQVIETHHGYVFKTVGDAFCAAFPTASDALTAVLTTQRHLQAPLSNLQIKVRMALHAGATEERDGDYFGPPVNRVARLLSAGHGGQTLISAAVEDLLRGHLSDGVALRDMGERRLKDLIRPEHIYQLLAPDLPADFPPLKTLDTFRTNLPAQLTSFVGREKELEKGKALITSNRLVTLVGPGGTGKTRLSLQVAANLLDTFSDGVWLVELAPLADPALVPQTTAYALGLRESSGRSMMDTLIDFLREKKSLVILDNCEHLVDAAAQLTENLLQACPHLHLLTSSREALGIAGEMPFRVPPLSIPEARQLSSLETALKTLEEYDAVRLFVERASTALPGFHITDGNAAALTQICQRLDGIPLALELAAARVKVLTVEQIAARLDDRFRLLTGGSRTALPRQQTLRALIDWSWELLSEPERVLLRRLSVFAGGWTLDAAESVAGQDGILSHEVLDLLIQLANKSLVVVDREQGVETRYRLLETIRQYAREKLLEAGEGQTVREAHLDYFVQLAEQAEPALTQANQVTWFKRLDEEMDNIRVALEWAQASQIEKGLRLGSAIWRFGLRQGYTSELVDWLTQLLAHFANVHASERAKALAATSRLFFWQNDVPRARAFAEEGLTISRELKDQRGEAANLYALGTATWAQADPMWEAFYLQSLAIYRSLKDSSGISELLIILGVFLRDEDPVRVRAYLEEALVLCRARGDVIGIAGTLDNLGVLAQAQGDLSQGRLWLEESLAIQRPLGPPGYSSTLQYLGELEMREGNYIQARAYCEEGLVMSEQAGLAWNVLWGIARLGHIELHTGNFEQSRATLTHALYRFAEVDTMIGVTYSMEGLASLAVGQGQFQNAARLFAWADMKRGELQDFRPPIEQADVDRDIATLIEKIGEEAFSAAYAEGKMMTMEEAIALALEETNPPSDNKNSPSGTGV